MDLELLDEKCFNCGAKNPHEEEIYYKYTHPNFGAESIGYKKASTITICIDCGAAWNAITLACIAFAIRNH